MTINRTLNEERGMAMVIALIVSFVLLILGTVIVAQSVHDVESSGLDRRRLQSINAAEAGNNYYYAYLQSTNVSLLQLPCPRRRPSPRRRPLQASRRHLPSFDNQSYRPQPMFLPIHRAQVYPASVAITTTGYGGGPNAAHNADIHPPHTGVRRVRPSDPCRTQLPNFTNNFESYGNNGNDGDIYVLNGNLSISNTPHIRGNVYVPNGSLSMRTTPTCSGRSGRTTPSRYLTAPPCRRTRSHRHHPSVEVVQSAGTQQLGPQSQVLRWEERPTRIRFHRHHPRSRSPRSRTWGSTRSTRPPIRSIRIRGRLRARTARTSCRARSAASPEPISSTSRARTRARSLPTTPPFPSPGT